MPERLQKIIARAGIVSRRKAEELIVAGRVTVNDTVVQELGSRADLATDRVCVDGKEVQSSENRRYLVMYKPRGCITSTSDPEGRTTVMDLLGPESARGLFPVGRLDYNTEGLLLLTDDGEFANRILAAKNKVPKTYEVKVSGRPSDDAIQKLRDGIKLDGRLSRPESIRLIKAAANPWYEITLVEGRNRQIHRMFERIGILVEKIRRVSVGNLTLKGLEPRQVRELQPREVQQLFEARPPARPTRLEARAPSRKRRDQGRGGRAERSRSRAPRKPRRPDDRQHTKSRQDGGRPSRSAGPRVKRSATPQRPRGKRPPTSERSPARARPTGRGGSPRRNSTRSRVPRSSRPGSRARP